MRRIVQGSRRISDERKRGRGGRVWCAAEESVIDSGEHRIGFEAHTVEVGAVVGFPYLMVARVGMVKLRELTLGGGGGLSEGG